LDVHDLSQRWRITRSSSVNAYLTDMADFRPNFTLFCVASFLQQGRSHYY